MLCGERDRHTFLFEWNSFQLKASDSYFVMVNGTLPSRMDGVKVRLRPSAIHCQNKITFPIHRPVMAMPNGCALVGGGWCRFTLLCNIIYDYILGHFDVAI